MGDPVADRILAALLQAKPNGLTRTEIHRDVLERNQKANRIVLALSSLLESGRARMVKEEGSGARDTEKWYAN